jgi:uncharacterized membrane protein YgdD (TMEM256/DUF423 family)
MIFWLTAVFAAILLEAADYHQDDEEGRGLMVVGERASTFLRPAVVFSRGLLPRAGCGCADRARSWPRMNAFLFRTAAALCFLAVALGAFGAHALKGKLAANAMTDVWNKAVLYHFVHAVVLLLLATLPAASRVASTLLLAGIVIFSGSLYLLALTNARWLGAITPLGGFCFLAGWFCLLIWPPRL